jgi:2-methylcitrate dehydratase
MAITSGRIQTEGIAKFRHNVTYEDLAPGRQERLERNVLDSLVSAVSALWRGRSKLALPRQRSLVVRTIIARLSVACRADVVYASSYNTALIRYIDFMDSRFAKGGLCHSSDNVWAILAVSEYANLSGKDFLTALAVAYQVEVALMDVAPLEKRAGSSLLSSR